MSMLYKILSFAIAFSSTISVAASETLRMQLDSAYFTEDRIDEIIDAYYIANDLDENTLSEEQITALQENLTEAYYDKININDNSTVRQRLERLQLLSPDQIESICRYVYLKGPLSSVNELLLIKGIYRQDILNLLPFVSVGDSDRPFVERNRKLKYALKYGRHELTVRGDNCPEATGDNTYYAGLRYKFHYGDRLFFGVNMEKDAGEQFWGKRNKGFDSYHGYFELDNTKWLKRLVLGEFKASFGKGLVMNSTFSLGFNSEISRTAYHPEGIMRSSSISESNLMHGAGATFKIHKFDITAFYSIKHVDASLSDSMTFSTINTSGTHITDSQINNEKTVWMQITGANVSTHIKNFNIGATVTHTWFDRTMEPNGRLYTSFLFNGKRQTAGSLSYSYRYGRFLFDGETAIQDNAAIATLNAVHFKPLSFLSIMAMYRNYSKKYDVVMSNALSEGSKVNNEEGITIGATVSPLPSTRITAYADFYSFPWYKYNVDKSSDGYRAYVRVDYFFRRHFTADVIVQIRNGERNLPQKYFADIPTMSYVDRYNRIGTRADLKFSCLHDRLIVRSTVEFNRFNYETQNKTYGWTIRNDLMYKLNRLPLSVTARLAYFRIPEYDNRIYTYENDVLYAFGSYVLYGEGLRYYLCARSNIN